MSYRFGVNEPIAQSVPRILGEEIDKAIAHMNAVHENTKAVHAARKAMKRAGALLVLVMPVARGKSCKTAVKRVRKAAKGLGAARDSQIVVEAAAALENASSDSRHRRLLGDVRSWLQARRDRTEAKPDPAETTASQQELLKLKMVFQSLKFRSADVGALLCSGQATYAEGREAMSIALDSEDENDLHNWRKLVQQHWRHMSLFAEAWPSESKARIALAQDLSETLGAHHDLAILRATILNNRSVFSDASDIKALSAIIDEKQRLLMSKAAVEGERLFAEKPKAFLKRFGVYWQTAGKVLRQNEAGTATAA